jgi:hypothetical protein
VDEDLARTGFKLLGLNHTGRASRRSVKLQQPKQDAETEFVDPEQPSGPADLGSGSSAAGSASSMFSANPGLTEEQIQEEFARQLADLQMAYTWSIVHSESQARITCDLAGSIDGYDGYARATFFLKSTVEGRRRNHARFDLPLFPLGRFRPDSDDVDVRLLPAEALDRGVRSSIETETVAAFQSSPSQQRPDVKWFPNTQKFAITCEKTGLTAAESAKRDQEVLAAQQRREEAQAKQDQAVERARSKAASARQNIHAKRDVGSLAISSNMELSDLVTPLDDPSVSLGGDDKGPKPLAPADGSAFYDSANIDQLVAAYFRAVCHELRPVLVSAEGGQVPISNWLYAIVDPRSLFEVRYHEILDQKGFHLHLFPVQPDRGVLQLDMKDIWVPIRRPDVFNVLARVAIADEKSQAAGDSGYSITGVRVSFDETKNVLGANAVSRAMDRLRNSCQQILEKSRKRRSLLGRPKSVSLRPPSSGSSDLSELPASSAVQPAAPSSIPVPSASAVEEKAGALPPVPAPVDAGGAMPAPTDSGRVVPVARGSAPTRGIGAPVLLGALASRPGGMVAPGVQKPTSQAARVFSHASGLTPQGVAAQKVAVGLSPKLQVLGGAPLPAPRAPLPVPGAGTPMVRPGPSVAVPRAVTRLDEEPLF